MSVEILCVDDEPAVLNSLRRNLYRRYPQWSLEVVESGYCAKERLLEKHFDVVVTDVSMPGITGLQLLEWIRSQADLLHTEVIVLTGLDDFSIKQQALELGASDLLTKPVALEELMARVKSSLRSKAYRDELVEKNRELESQLIKAQRAELVGELAAGINHDLKNLLGSIISYSDYLSVQDITEKIVKEGVVDINEAATRAFQYLTQIHGLSRPERAAAQKVNLGNMIVEAIQLLSKTMKSSLVFDPDGCDWYVVGDETQLYQIMLNLCINADQAMDDSRKGVIEVSIEQEDSGGMLCWSFKDNGSGMNEKTREHLFERSYTTKSKSGGTGLGLSIVKSVVENHSGTIAVQSELGQGSTFEIRLPACCSKDPVRLEGVWHE